MTSTAIAAATLVSSSALWQAFGTGTMPVETALTRFVVVLVLSWLALSVVSELAFNTGPVPADASKDPGSTDGVAAEGLSAGLDD